MSEIFTAYGKCIMNSTRGTVQFECASDDDAVRVTLVLNGRAERLEAQAKRIFKLEVALKPFAAINPSSFYPANGSDEEQYIIVLKGWHKSPTQFTGADLRRARTALEDTP